MELPQSEQAHLRKWALQEIPKPPRFFTHPVGDGRGNEQVLELVRQAVIKQWYVICFDEFDLIRATWQQRDRAMAEILIREWEQNRPHQKVICVCGNIHSRLTQRAGISEQYWPSFASNLQLLKPGVSVKSVNVVFHQGTFFNIKIRKIHGSAIREPYISNDRSDGHSVALHLPTATPATHLTKPPNEFSQFLRVTPWIVLKFVKRFKIKE